MLINIFTDNFFSGFSDEHKAKKNEITVTFDELIASLLNKIICKKSY